MAAVVTYETDAYRRLRNIVRAVLCVAWIWFIYKANAPNPGSFFANVGDSLALGFAIITSPVALIPAGMITRLLAGVLQTSESVVRIHKDKIEEKKIHRLLQDESRANEVAATEALLQHRRKEVIDKFGVVHDFLHLLETESDAQRKTTIRLEIGHTLRDLIGKYSLDDLSALIRSDHAVAESIRHALANLDKANLGDGVEVSLLRRAAAG